MATTETYPVTALRDALERTAADASLDPEARVRELQQVRDRINHLVGHADSLIGQQRLAVEAAALGEADRADRAASDADLRAELIRRGMATAEQCDAMGLLDADEVDAREAEGSLAEAAGDWYLFANGDGNASTGTNGTTSTIDFTVAYDSATVEENGAVEPDDEPDVGPPEQTEAEQGDVPDDRPEDASDTDAGQDGRTAPASTLTEAELLTAFAEGDATATEVVVSPDLDLIARRILTAPLDPEARIGPLVGLLECRVDHSLPPRTWRLGSDAGPA